MEIKSAKLVTCKSDISLKNYKLRIANPNLSSKSALPCSLDKVSAILPYLLAESLIRSGASFY